MFNRQVISMARRYFIQTSPYKTDRTKRKSRAIAPPKLADNEKFKGSLFYYWWAFLRLNPAYIKTCENEGGGRLSKLYQDFGDVREDNFWQWWKTHNHLFMEPEAGHAREIVNLNEYEKKPNTILLEVPIDKKLALRVRQVKRILAVKMSADKYLMAKSYAQYKVTGKPVVAALAKYVHAWQLKKEQPKLPYAIIYEIVNGRNINIEEAMKPRVILGQINPNPDYNVPKTQMGLRYVRAANQIIENVIKGEFPIFKKSKQSKPLKRSD